MRCISELTENGKTQKIIFNSDNVDYWYSENIGNEIRYMVVLKSGSILPVDKATFDYIESKLSV